jgi:hypothetical protein
MKSTLTMLLSGLAAAAFPLATAQGANLNLPKSIEAGSAFSIQSAGSGKGTLYIVGPGDVLKRDIQLGETTSFDSGSLYNAGHYIVVISGGASTDSGSFDVVPASQPANLSFFAKPSRLPVGLQKGITGAVYTFDSYQNLITVATPVSFELSNPSGAIQRRAMTTRGGAAWTEMDSSPQEGAAKFVARAGTIASTRVVRQVPGDPCGIKMSARPSGKQIQLETAPIRDCSGNAVPDGTIVTFTENYGGAQSTVDVPIKRGIATVEMPAHNGARISVASGLMMGNEIRWGK